MEDKVYRHEIKFLLSKMEYNELRLLLDAVMNKDEHMIEHGEYYIRSLYFDSFDNRDYREYMILQPKR